MKYSELIVFEPLTTVIKIADDSKAEKRKHNAYFNSCSKSGYKWKNN